MKILLGSHGRFASGIKSSLKVLIGDEAERISVIDAYVDDNNIDVELENYFKTIDPDEQVLMLSDLYGGSVNQKMYLYLSRPNTYLIAGVNLSLVIELCLKSDMDIEEAKETIATAREMMKLVEFKDDSPVDDDFL